MRKGTKVEMYANRNYIGPGAPGGLSGNGRKKLSPNEYMQPGVNRKMKKTKPKKSTPSKLKGMNTTLAYNARGYKGYNS